MARLLSSKQNVQPANSEFPYGRIKDNTGANDGTPVNEEVYGDFHQFFAKMFAASGLVANGEPDNAYDGFQLYEAFEKLVGMQEWQVMPYSAGYYAGIGTWTVGSSDVQYSRYKKVGKTIYLDFNIDNTTIGASTSTLIIFTQSMLGVTYPNVANGSGLPVLYNNGSSIILVQAKLAFNGINITKLDGSNFTVGTDNQSFRFNLVIPIN